MFKAEKIHSGQYRRYGDSFYKWAIESDLSKEQVLKKCFNELAKAEYPNYEEWLKNVNGDMKGNLGYYFHGYYTLDETKMGYHFTVCHPYTD